MPQTRESDLRVFVDMFRAYGDEARDMTEVRASEGSLRLKVQSLEQQARRHRLQHISGCLSCTSIGSVARCSNLFGMQVHQE